MKTRNRILLLSSLLLLVSVGGIGNIVWQLPHVEQMQDLKAVLHCLILLGLFGTGLIFSVLELVRQEFMSPIFQLAVQVARLKERKIDGHRLELTGSKDIDLLTRALNDLLDGFEKEENLYRIFAESSPDMIFLLDRDGRVLFGNLNAARQWNYQAEEIIGKRQEELFPPDIAMRHKQAVEKIFNSGQPICLDVHEKIGQRQCWIDARMVPVLNKDGRVTAVLGISRDISKRKQAEDALRIKDIAIASSIDGIAISDLAGNLNYVNDAFLKLWGYDNEQEVIGKSYSVFWENPAQAQWVVDALKRKGQWAGELNGKKKNGSAIYVQLSANMVTDSAGNALGMMASFLDITEIKQTQDLLQQERATLNSIIDRNPYGIQIFDAEGHYVRSNQAFFNMFQSVPPTDYCIFDDPIIKKTGFNEEVHLAIKEGKSHMNPEAWYNPRWLYPELPDKLSCFRSTVFPIMNTGGKMDCFVVMFEDITERKQVEEELKKSVNLLIEMTIRVPGVVYQFYSRPNGEMGFYYISNRSEQVMGLKPDLEGYLERFVALVIPEHRQGFIKSIEKSVREASEWKYEGILQKPSGEKIWFAGNSTPSPRKNEMVFNGIVSDITERKRAEQKAAMLSDAIENAHHGCLIISEDYKVVFANNYVLTKLGFDFEESKNMDLFSLCADREQVKDIIETMKVTRRWMGEVAIIKKDGGQFPALVSITALGADGEASGRGGNIILVQDITIQKEIREKLLTSEKLAVMGRLVADVSHELNNPLAIVIGGTQLMISRIDDKTQTTTFKSQLETVLRNARRCKTILGNLLGYGRTIGKKEEAVNLPDLIREAIDDVNYQHDMSAIETVFNYNELAVAEITGNKSALLSVFVNLIRNARQAMGEKGRLTVTIEKEDAKHLRIEIHDTGIGMNKEQKTKLFKPFASGWKEREGSGLGLATSLGIIETHGGSMSAESAGEGKGATFTIILPCEVQKKK